MRATAGKSWRASRNRPAVQRRGVRRGLQRRTPRGPAVFALRLGTPIVFGVALRAPSGRYQLTFEPIETRDTGDREADVDRIVTEYTAVLEKWVRRAPEQYLWHHRRWKHQRPGTPPELGDPL